MFNLNGFGKLISKTKAVSRSMLSIVLALCLVAVMLPTGLGILSVSADDKWDGSSTEAFAAGAGTATDPFQISNGAQLAYLAQKVNDGTQVTTNTHFKLTADIYLDEQAWTPIGTSANRFKGTFDGDNYTVYGLKCEQTTDNVGLFGYAASAMIRNINVRDGFVKGAQKVGGIVGYANVSALENCGFDGDVQATGKDVGGLIGYAYGNAGVTVTNCWTTGAVQGANANVGGLVGNALKYSTTVTPVKCYNSYSAMTVTRTSAENFQYSVGGLLGADNVNCVIQNCYFAGTVENSGCAIVGAGTAGTISTDLSNQVYYKAGACTGTHGATANAAAISVEVTAVAAVTAQLNVTATEKGWAQWVMDTQNGYPIFAVAPELTNLSLSSGTFVFNPSERNYAVTISNETFTVTPTAKDGTTVTVDGVPVDSGNPSAPYMLADGQSITIEVIASRDAITHQYTITVTRNTAVWDGSSVEPFLHYDELGYGTEDRPYEIANGAQLYFLSKTVQETVIIGETVYPKSVYKDKYFKLVGNIDLNNMKWTPIGDDIVYVGGDAVNRFAAKGFDGDGHTISNILVQRDNDAGLFGYLNGTTVKNLTVKGVIKGATHSGGIAAHAQAATFENCGFDGLIENTGGYAGGIAARIRSSAVTLKNCWVAGTLKSGSKNIGGLVGSSGTVPLTVTNCYSVMTVKRVNNIGAVGETDNKTNENGPGGLVGSGTVVTLSNCHFAGYVNNGCPITVSTPLSAENVFYKADSYDAEFGLSDTTAGMPKSVDEFKNGQVTAALNSMVTNSNGLIPWMDGEDYPVFKPLSKLSNLIVSQGAIFFDPTVFEYYVTVRDTVSSITVTPSAAEGYVIQVNGTAVQSGTTSAAVSLTIGQTTDIVVGVASAEMADSPTAFTEYTVKVKRVNAPSAGVWDGTYEEFAGGSGSAENPYQIANARQLAFLAAMVNGQTVVINDKTYTPPEAKYGLAYNADYFVLTADIVLNDISDIATWGTIPPVNNWTPIGGKFSDGSRHFGGTIDCAGHTISGLYSKNLTADRGVGLFGTIATATVKNLTVKDAYIEGTNYVGGITGKVGDSSKLSNCSLTGTVISAGSYAGGLVGEILGSNITVTGCWTDGDLFGARSLGGLVGRTGVGAADAAIIIESSYSAMNITSSATAAAAGLIGTIGGATNSTVRITGCHFAGTTNLNFPIVGHIETGNIYTIVANNVYYCEACCTAPTVLLTEVGKSADEFANGTVADLLNQSVLGTINWSTDTTKGYPTIQAVTADIALKGLVLSGGVIGFDPQVYEYTVYVPNKVNKVSIVPSAADGVVIKVNGQIVKSDTASSEIDLEVGVAKRFTIQVSRDGASIVYAVDVVRREQASVGVWDGSYEAFDMSNDAGKSIDNPILIKNEAQFAFLAAMVNGQTVMVDGKIYTVPRNNANGAVYSDTFFQLKADLNLNSVENYDNWDTVAPLNAWTPIGYCGEVTRNARMFGGTFDGDHHTITGLYINEPTRGVEGTGLFGGTSNATVRNLHVRNGYVFGSQRIGGIIGRCRNKVTVQNCSFVGTLKSSVTSTANHSYVAGIIGDVNGKTYVNSCWSEGTVIGSMGSAGLVGGMYLSGVYEIDNCYSAMEIVTPDGCTRAGGLVGALSAGGSVDIRRSHFAGTILSNTPIVGGTDGTGGQTVTVSDTYYVTGSFVGTVDEELCGDAEEKSVEEFADGTVTELLNAAAAYGDFWNWKDGEKGYPISDGVILVTDYKDYTDDSEFDDGNWAAGFVNMDDDAVSGSGNGSENGSDNELNDSPITGETSLYIVVIGLLLISAICAVFLSRRKQNET